MASPELKEIQERFVAVVAGLSDDPARLRAMVHSDRRFGAAARLEVYANAYVGRLFACLKEDFAVTARLMGDARFLGLVRDYLRANPPAKPSIMQAGERLGDFLASYPAGSQEPWLADLARFERTLIDVFHEADVPVRTAEEMWRIAPARWPLLEIRAIAALRMLDCRWRVLPLYRAVQSGTTLPKPAPDAVTVLVWRQNQLVYYRELEQNVERVALAAATEGAGFAEICELAARQLAGPDPVAEIAALLRRWLADGLLAKRPLPHGAER